MILNMMTVGMIPNDDDSGVYDGDNISDLKHDDSGNDI